MKGCCHGTAASGNHADMLKSHVSPGTQYLDAICAESDLRALANFTQNRFCGPHPRHTKKQLPGENANWIDN
jgi:hypothetical protein